MKVLWITNVPIGKHKDLLGVGNAQSGGWIETTYKELKDASELELGICTLYSGNTIQQMREGNNIFYLIPSKTSVSTYIPYCSDNIQTWETIIKEFAPDIIQLWGTEYAMGVDIVHCCCGIPIVVYIQGVMRQIYNHQLDGISFAEEKHFATWKDWLKRGGSWFDKKAQQNVIRNEQYIVSHAKGVIVESDWCGDQYRAVNPQLQLFYSKLPVNSDFSSNKWNLENTNRYTIFTTAGGNPVKGHHLLFKALSIVKQVYPQVKLVIPGNSSYMNNDNVSKFAYSKYLKHLIEDSSLHDNIEYVGKLGSKEMTQIMLKSHVYVMPSVIENHSSSLIEAMMIGMPVISSYVGGVAAYLENSKNGLFYRATEPEVLAANIIRLFNDDTLSKRLAEDAYSTTRQSRLNNNLKVQYLDLYNMVLNTR